MAKKVLNAAGMKIRNQKKILEILMTSECSRADLARKIGLTRAAISVIADELSEQLYIVEGNPILGKVGRKSYVLKINPDRFYIAGINLARDGCAIGIVNFCGDILYHFQMPLFKTASESMERIYKKIDQVIKKNSFPGIFMGIGITAPGPLDSESGRILTPPNFEQWFHVDVVSFFEKRFSCPVILENNANALALAEKYYGLGNLYKKYVELTVDTGIGSGVILDGKLYKGSSGFGNDFGHMSINFNGPLCKCGNVGCAELYASIPNIIHYAQTINSKFTDWNVLIDLALSGDASAKAVVEKEAFYLSVVITNIMNILDVDGVIMAGSITYKGDMLNELIRTYVNNHFFGRTIKKLDIVSSSIITHAPIISSANLIVEQFLKA